MGILEIIGAFIFTIGGFELLCFIGDKIAFVDKDKTKNR